MFTEQHFYEIFGYYDQKRFIRIERTYEVRCPHTPPLSINALQDGTIPEMMEMNITEVKLREYADKNSRRIGLAGKCSTCAKVYYTERY